MSKFSDAAFLAFQYAAPKRLLTNAAGLLADRRLGWLTTFIIGRFISRYGIDMDIAAKEKAGDYETFNSFFTRALKDGARPVDSDPESVVFPVDGTVSQSGTVTQGRIIQAKGFDYSLNTLLGGDRRISAPFQDGTFVTIYLSPKDYHRVHIPFDGKLKKTVFVPGKLYSVNPLTASSINSLFAINERLICIFETAFGDMAVVLVGATIVGSMETVWDGTARGKKVEVRDFSDKDIVFGKGDEIGRFKLGSTVICVFPKDTVRLSESISPFLATQMGVGMGKTAMRISEND